MNKRFRPWDSGKGSGEITPSVGGYTIVCKPTDEIRNSVGTLTNDAYLKFSVVANGIYRFDLILRAYTNNDNKIMFFLNSPTGATMQWGELTNGNFSPTDFDETTIWTMYSNFTSPAIGIDWRWYSGIIVVGSTPGEICLQWCQENSRAFDTTMLGGSHLVFAKVN